MEGDGKKTLAVDWLSGVPTVSFFFTTATNNYNINISWR
jgi:hypothetical protein